MKKVAPRVLLALGLVAALGLALPVAASAGSGPTPAQQHTYYQELRQYQKSRNAIDATFQAAVQLAREAYFQATGSATTFAERSVARQVMEAAIIQAAALRSQALISLGNPPAWP